MKTAYKNLRKIMDELSMCAGVESRARLTVASGAEATKKQLGSIKQMLNIGHVEFDTEELFASNPKDRGR